MFEWRLLFEPVAGRIAPTGQVLQVTCQLCGRPFNPMRAILAKHAGHHVKVTDVETRLNDSNGPHFRRWEYR